VAAFIIGAVDQDAVDAGFPHLSEGDFLLAAGFGDAPLFCRWCLKGSRYGWWQTTRRRHSGRSIWPHSRATVSLMKTIWVIFVLALITVAGEIYADAVMTTSQVAPAAPDLPVAAGHTANPG
jgi:hypothetical protein